MANRKNTFLLKRSNVVNKTPSLGDIQLGELALNTADAKLFSTYTGGLTGATEIREIGWDRLSTISGGTVNGDVIINADLTVTGDTQLVNVSGTSFYTDYIDFNNALSPLPTDIEGRIYWDEDNGTVSLGMHGGQVVQQVGLEQYYYVKNQSGATIDNGRVVRAAGTLGSSGRILGEYMIADGTIPAKYTLGIATEDIINGDDGYVTEFGLVRGINTTGSLYGETWNDGDILWVSPTIPGGLTSVEPTAPDLKIEMAIVIDADANGSIFVRPNRYPYLYDLQQVNYSAGTENNLDILQWNNSNQTWDKTNTPSFQELTITNGLSACTGIYTSNIYSCSPLNINPNDEGNIYFGSTSGVTIDVANNRLGVNTSSPTQKVHIDEGILRIENSDPDLSTINSVRENGIRLDAGSTSSYGEIRPYNGPNNTRIGLSFWASNPTPTEVLRIQPNGDIGIGTTSPTSKLDVNGDVTITNKIIHSGDTDTDLQFENDLIQIQAGGDRQLIIDTVGSGRTRIQNQLHAGNFADLSGSNNYTLHDGVSSIMKMSQFVTTTLVVSGNILAAETAGEDVSRGQLVYKDTNGTWKKASATSSGEVDKMLGIALNSAASSADLDVLIDGVLNYISTIHEQLNSPTPGAPLYASTTAGNITETEPSTTGNIVKVIGHNINSGTVGRTRIVLVRFNPDNSWIEL